MAAALPDLDYRAIDGPFPEWHRQVLEQRLKEADANPQAAIPWEQVRERLR
jgi:putative addiction module component (TIGR02574 family)